MTDKLPCDCDYEDCMCPVTEKEWNYLRKQVSRGRFDLIMKFLRDFNEEKDNEIERLNKEKKNIADCVFEEISQLKKDIERLNKENWIIPKNPKTWKELSESVRAIKPFKDLIDNYENQLKEQKKKIEGMVKGLGEWWVDILTQIEKTNEFNIEKAGSDFDRIEKELKSLKKEVK